MPQVSILTRQGRHSLQRNVCVRKVGKGAGERGWGGGGGGVEQAGEGGGWIGVARGRGEYTGESYLGLNKVNAQLERGQLMGVKLHSSSASHG